jgi:deoxyribodipyrimidine photolyase-related protein
MIEKFNQLYTSSISLIFPHQLFEEHPALDFNRVVYLVEEYLFFKQYKFHKQKLLFHRSSMKFYQDYLSSKKYKVIYIESNNELSDIRKLIPSFKQNGIKEIHIADVADNWLSKRIKQTAEEEGIRICEYPSPCFLNSKEDINEYFEDKKKYFQTDFYIKQRKKFRILLDENDIPFGGKWTFDTENRLKYPVKKIPPKINFSSPNKYYEEAKNYISNYFSDNYGIINEHFIYPNNFNDCKKWFSEFLTRRFVEYGHYQDAIVARENILHHSVISPLINIGLITPKFVLEETLKFSHANKIPLNSIEGFIRQIIGWREFIRGVYEISGTYQRTKNLWGFKRKIPKSFWNGTTGIKPIDVTITKVLQTGYCHHIERLMVLGNFMLLCEFDPDEVYKWFMEMFVDAFDWVMVPNVYGMSQFADGGLMSTKPYISGSNYLMKMSDYKKGDWQEIWDGLFWRFINNHRDFFIKNSRMNVLLKSFDNMNNQKKQGLLNKAEEYLKSLE